MVETAIGSFLSLARPFSARAGDRVGLRMVAWTCVQPGRKASAASKPISPCLFPVISTDGHIRLLGGVSRPPILLHSRWEQRKICTELVSLAPTIFPSHPAIAPVADLALSD